MREINSKIFFRSEKYTIAVRSHESLPPVGVLVPEVEIVPVDPVVQDQREDEEGAEEAQGGEEEAEGEEAEGAAVPIADVEAHHVRNLFSLPHERRVALPNKSNAKLSYQYP